MTKHYTDNEVRDMIEALKPLAVYKELHHAAPMMESIIAERDAYRNTLETIAQSGECERDAEYAIGTLADIRRLVGLEEGEDDGRS